MSDITGDFVRALAAANGLELPDERIELVRAQYERYLQTLKELNALPLAREAEPAITYGFPSEKGR
jgi:hypothetical protein